MRKVMTIVGTRPELIKMSRVIAKLDQHTDHVLVHTGQNYDYELNQIFFDDLQIRKPDFFLNASGESASQLIGQVIAKSDEVIEKVRPDAVLLYGDTNSCLSVISAKRRKVPVFHFEAGNRCFDQRVPEELNRKIVDHLSDINLVLSEHARRYLMAEGVRPESIIKTGSHMPEVFKHYSEKINRSDALDRFSLKRDKYFLISMHREENVDVHDNLVSMIESLNLLARTYDYPLVVSTHPRTRKRLEEFSITNIDERIKFLSPLGFFDYNKLQMSAFCVISDSGTVTEEASILKIPAITIRNAHERPEGMDAGTLIMSGLLPDSVLDAVKVVSHSRAPGSVEDYDREKVSDQIVRIVLSYIDYINRTVWQRVR